MLLGASKINFNKNGHLKSECAIYITQSGTAFEIKLAIFYK